MPPACTPNQIKLLEATAASAAVAIVGLDKNAGKTTVLNALVHAWQKRARPLVLTSIGYDGEKTDLLHGHAKPQIYVFPGMSVITAADFLARSTIDAEIRHVFDIATVVGRPVLADARQAGFVTLAGPTSLHELIEMQHAVLADTPDALFVIDGAFGRRMNAAEAYADTVIFCLSATEQNAQDVIDAFVHRQRLMQLPLAPDRYGAAMQTPPTAKEGLTYAKTTIDGHGCILLRGALTDSIALHLMTNELNEGGALIIEDRANAFVTGGLLRRMEQSGLTLYALRGARLALVALNPSCVRDASRFLSALQEAAAVPVLVLDSVPSIGKAL